MAPSLLRRKVDKRLDSFDDGEAAQFQAIGECRSE